jgi:hypothetical protein
MYENGTMKVLRSKKMFFLSSLSLSWNSLFPAKFTDCLAWLAARHKVNE